MDWLASAQVEPQELDYLDRHFVVRVPAGERELPRNVNQLAGLPESDRAGRWMLVKAGSPPFFAPYRTHSPLQPHEYDLIPLYRELAVAWRLRVASWYALHQDPTWRWRDEVYRLLDAVGGRPLRRSPGW